ncbi:hypothetical protein APHWI1_0394 [Anaplasma phagocytophilum str. ApWI1]|uniref:Uncharacterized protein n=3 Tax=Anaplasma phagocytophilum TaxID=948 RepID=A0A0F3NI44_ANAPH|nr:hypothetical protein APHWEB_1121 [Anaplasma phagocytophilum str. Webster]KJV64936.1 hypothetical protein APHMUC_0585 [Anaplasma phagocytophilum str. ApMUC09]KJV67680.1 hypothetical protein APHNP_0379 [Anaplasma phagocytophilum str. ApNP]KJV82278.1 hypothetical protein APHHGE2_1191 [Anaplasma phagocytophilum str. HGE2]KJV84683.1 hypothetical protein APHWI1_0394 [Anaplasma phagocytophilum str. ApWI1]KJV86853.1 hypothetical protein APHNYW_0906 [Anaplasma phagocytophilum str. ApNYW]KJV98393.1 
MAKEILINMGSISMNMLRYYNFFEFSIFSYHKPSRFCL